MPWDAAPIGIGSGSVACTVVTILSSLQKIPLYFCLKFILPVGGRKSEITKLS
jgi:hypothetical protein